MQNFLRFIFSFKFFIFISPIADIVLPATTQAKFVINIGENSNIFFFDIISIGAFGMYLFFNKPLSISRHINSLLIIFLIAGIVWNSFSVVGNVLSEPFLRVFYCSDFLFTGLFLYFIQYDRAEIRYLSIVFLCLLFVLIVETFLLYFGIIIYESNLLSDTIRRAGTTAGPATASGYLIFIMMLFVLFFFQKKRNIILFLSGLSIFFTLARGPILAYLLFLSVFALNYIYQSKLVKKVSYVVALFFIAFLLEQYLHVTEVYEMRQRNIEQYQNRFGDNTTGRIDLWKFTMRLLSQNGIDNYITGIGIGSVPMRRNEISGDNWAVSASHNVYLGVLLDSGIIGLSFLIYLWWIILKRIWDYNKLLVAGLVIFLGTGYMTESHTFSLNYSMFIWLLFYNCHLQEDELSKKNR